MKKPKFKILKNIGWNVISFFDFGNHNLRKTRIFLICGFVVLLSSIGITQNNQSQITNTNSELKSERKIMNKSNKKRVNQTISKNTPSIDTSSASDTREYQLALMARNPSMQEEAPESGKNETNPSLSILKEIGTKPATQDGNLFDKGVCLTGGNMEWYINNQITKDMNLPSDLKISFDPYNATIYSNQELSDNVKLRINNIYQTCELSVIYPDLKFQIVN